MSWKDSKELFARTQQGLKRANQRIATLARKYGTDSDVFKNEVAFLEKEPLRKYFRDEDGNFFTSGAGPGGGRTRGQKKTKSSAQGNPKINIRAFNEDIRKGNLSRTEANLLLLQAAGMRIESDGDVVQAGVGITTVKALKNQARARLESYGEDPGKIMEADIEREIKREAEIKNSFDTEYDDIVAEYGIEKIKEFKVVKDLFHKRDKNGKVIEKRKDLTYDDVKRITDEMKRLNKEKSNAARKFEKAAQAKEPKKTRRRRK